MNYNSFNFVVVFPLIFLGYYLIPAKYLKVRNAFLLLVSYLLYISWNPSWSTILLWVTIVSFVTALILQRKNSRRRATLVFGGAILVLPLFMFKYFDFINNVASELLSKAGTPYHLPGLNWVIPLGLSFYTIQAFSYVFDVYYRRIEAERDFWAYALYVSFFPSILSGPINRVSLIIPQIKRLRTYFDYHKAVDGLRMILWGMFMKVVVADNAGLYVGTVLDAYQNYSGTECFVASVMYSIQIYADFGGYSLMAIGVGKTLGFEMARNFRQPFFAHSVSDYWTRWHLSFSSWLKDYVYIPLGGSRKGKWRTYRNIFLTFLVSGIWHGANWTYILWGVWHSICIMAERMTNQQKCRYGGLGKAMKIIIAFLLVDFSRILFHMPSVTEACDVMAKILTDQTIEQTTWPAATTLFFVAILLVKELRDEFFAGRLKVFSNSISGVRWSAYVIILTVILLQGVLGSDSFIYANF